MSNSVAELQIRKCRGMGKPTYLQSAMVYISTSATLLLAGERDHQMWRREQGALHVIKAEG